MCCCLKNKAYENQIISLRLFELLSGQSGLPLNPPFTEKIIKRTADINQLLLAHMNTDGFQHPVFSRPVSIPTGPCLLKVTASSLRELTNPFRIAYISSIFPRHDP